MTEPQPEATDPIDRMLERIRRTLLDLTRRNRLLNFRVGKSKVALSIVDELPAEVFRSLVIEGKAMNFLAREEAKEGAALEPTPTPAPADEASFDDEGGPHGLAVDDVAGDGDEVEGLDSARADEDPGDAADELGLASLDEPAERAERHTDLYLQTALTGERLQKVLVHLAREARSALDERGTNVLFLTLGTVEWTEPSQPNLVSRAPLLFVPVELKRKNVNRRYRVAMFDADVVTNPSLLELGRRSLGVELPAADLEQEFDLEAYFLEVKAAIESIPGWSFEPEVHLGLFSFAKLLLYQDLDPDRWPDDANIRRHPMIRLLAGVPGAEPPLGAELPDPRRLDDMTEPEQCFQVVNADSSQLAAVIAAKHGANLVIQGPPGTGKSQTITNIVAECLAAGKSVLFVAEKAAALEVVHGRMTRAGLGEFVLDLHSRTVSRRRVLEELRRALDAEGEAVDEDTDGRELSRTRAELNAYVNEIKRPLGGLGLSVYDAMGRAVASRAAEEVAFELPDYFEWTEDELDQILEDVGALDRCLQRVGDVSRHPFRGSRLMRGGLEVRQRLSARHAAASEALAKLGEAAAPLAERLGCEPPSTLLRVDEVLEDAAALAHAPATCASMIGDARFDRVDPALRRWLQQGGERQALRERWSKVMEADAEAADWTDTLERRRVDGGSLLRWLKPSWHRDNRRIATYRRDGVDVGAAEELEVLKALVASGALRRELEAGVATHAAVLGDPFTGLDGDFRALTHAVDTAVALRERVRSSRIGAAAARAVLGSVRRTELDELRARLSAQAGDVRAELDRLLEALEATPNDFLGADRDAADLSHITERVDTVARDLDRLQDWVDFQVVWSGCREGSKRERLAPFLALALGPDGGAYAGRLAEILRRQFYHLYADRALEESPALRRFRGEDRRALIDRFQAADREWIDVSRARLRALLFRRRPDYSHEAGPTSKLGILKHEMRKKRRHMPLRKLLDLVGDVVRGIKPCFMMSPASVAQFLTPGRHAFDVVIFDEASQVEPADALGAIARGRQLLLIGDENQLPPTDFFGRIDDTSVATDDLASPTELESILGLGAVRFPASNQCSLRWHYRSLHQSLIEFSNARFYDGQLRIFPSPHADRSQYGLVFEHVEDGVYQRGAGHNAVEAQAVAAAAVQHAVEHPELSLGIGAFSLSQQRAIEDHVELLRRRSDDPRVEAFFSAERDEPFFVKNLETIQGDERDVILLSVGYGPDRYGKVSMNFGPLNKDGGWRRLNVLITRSRRRCVVFSSMRSDAIRLDATDAEGVRALKEYLATAQLGEVTEIAVAGGGVESPFEEAVLRALEARGFQVHTQVGVAGFHIDLAVVDPRNPGVYLLGIECDGAVYHSSPTARDRDRIRQEVLEGRGWTIERVWSTDWYRRPGAIVDRLCERIQRLMDGGVDDDPTTPTEPESETAQESADRASVVGDPSERAGVPPVQEVAAPPGGSGPPPDAALDERVVPYVRAGARSLGSYEDLVDGDPGAMEAALVELVSIEGPIHREEAQRVALTWYEARSTAKAREAFDRVVTVVVEQGRVEKRGDFLWPSAATGPRPIRHRGHDDAVTDPDHIADEEYEVAVLWVARREMGSQPDALVTSVARALGFARTTSRLAAQLDRIVATLRERGALVEDGAGFLTVAAGGEV